MCVGGGEGKGPLTHIHTTTVPQHSGNAGVCVSVWPTHSESEGQGSGCTTCGTVDECICVRQAGDAFASSSGQQRFKALHCPCTAAR